ncbi:MAG: hypothetical protein LLF97_08345 [Planctomycetaceae bacterium]|nr:hypothetical protein [Planctomycetaceae bacterium]
MSADNLWPDAKKFAFTIFDDTDNATVANVGPVYSFLADCGFRTTKSVWVVDGNPHRGNCVGDSCAKPDYLRWVKNLQSRGFEIGFHNCSWHGLPRDEIRAALDRFVDLFGNNPQSAANHTGVEESIYWADARLSGWRRWVYNLLTRFHNYKRFTGHVEGNEYFWGDFCKERIKYLRNFTYHEINTLKACPFMPYHDPQRPFVNYWFASSDGHDLPTFNECLSEENQDRLEEEGGACIMYTHFAKKFCEDGKLNPRFRELMLRLSKKNGWFVPTATLLDYLLKVNGHHAISNAERRGLEMKWLGEKIFTGTT